MKFKLKKTAQVQVRDLLRARNVGNIPARVAQLAEAAPLAGVAVQPEAIAPN